MDERQEMTTIEVEKMLKTLQHHYHEAGSESETSSSRNYDLKLGISLVNVSHVQLITISEYCFRLLESTLLLYMALICFTVRHVLNFFF
jgi:hypothetical protein